MPPRARANTHASAGSPGVPKQLPARGYFGMEPEKAFPAFGLSDMASDFDFSLTQGGGTTLPVTLVCPWGRGVADFLAPHPAKGLGRLLAFFSEHGVAPGAPRVALDELFAAAGSDVHAYTHKRNREMPAEAGGSPFTLDARIAFMGTYRFLLITEAVADEDWLSPEWSQAILAGAVPVYIGGPPNLAAYALPGGYVDGSRFASGAELWKYLSSFDGNAANEAYNRFFDWKRGAALAFAEDEPEGAGALGTGDGVAPSACKPETVAATAAWPLPPVPGAPLPTEADAAALDVLAAEAWRCFRRALDRCVHYAECRICRHVHQIT